MQQRRSEKRKPRTSFDEKDKLIFLNIIKNSEGGSFAKVITSKYSESEGSAILFNFGRMFNNDPPEDDDEEDLDDDRDTEEYRNVRMETLFV